MTASTNAAALPDFVMVPRVPTVSMLLRMRAVIEKAYSHSNYSSMYKEKHAYAAMIAAAPESPALTQPAAAPVTGWISVTDRVPEQRDASYQVVASCVKQYKADTNYPGQGIKGIYQDWVIRKWPHNFTHWAPMPGTEAAPVEPTSDEQEPVATVSRNSDDSLTFTPLRDFYVVNGMPLFAAPVEQDLTGAQFAAAQHLHTVQVQADALAALRVERDLLSASLKQRDGLVDQLVAALKNAHPYVTSDAARIEIGAALASAGETS